MTLLAFVLGVFLVQQLAALPILSAATALGLAVVWGLLLCLRKISTRRLTIDLLMVTVALGAGFAYGVWRAELRMNDALAPALQGKNLEVTGEIASLPQWNMDPDSEEALSLSFLLRMATPPPGVPHQIRLTWYGPRDEERLALRPGALWHFTVRLKRPHASQNAHVYDFEGWLLGQNIRASGYVYRTKSNPGNNVFLHQQHWTVDGVREHVRTDIERALPLAQYPYRGMLTALSVGDQNAIPDTQWATFARTGVTHLMSISGLHITMMAALAFSLALWLWRIRPYASWPAPKVAAIGGVIGAVAYTLLAGSGVPAQRTLYMVVTLALCVWFGRPLASWRTLATALFIVTLLDPWAVLAAGFWLSFGAVALLIHISAGQTAMRPNRWISTVKAQWAMTIALVPLLLVLFQQFSLVSPLANAIAIPWISFVISPLAILGGLMGWDWLLQLTHNLLAPLMNILTWLAHAPVWQQAEPPLWAALLGGGGALAVFAPPHWPGRAAALLALLPMLAWTPQRPQQGELWATVLDVGQGNAVFVQTAHHNLLVDAGPSFRGSPSDSGARIVAPFLRGEGVRQLDRLLLSHADSDHVGGAESVLASVPVADGLGYQPPTAEIAWQPCQQGQSWQWDGVDFSVLHPSAQMLARYAGKRNETSCVVSITADGGSLLLPGDIPAAVEAQLAETMPEKLSSDILIAAHHGSKSSTSQAWLDAVAPSHAIFSVGYRSQYGHPDPAVLARLAGLPDVTLWRTDTQGAIFIRITRTAIHIDTQRQRRRRYWQDQDGD